MEPSGACAPSVNECITIGAIIIDPLWASARARYAALAHNGSIIIAPMVMHSLTLGAHAPEGSSVL